MKIKKVFLAALSFVLPLSLISCEHKQSSGEDKPLIEDENTIYQKIQDIYVSIEQDFYKFVKVATFVTNNTPWSPNNTTNGRQQLNAGIFNYVPERNKHNGYIKISTADDFNNFIIKKYIEWHDVSNVEGIESEIKKYFEDVFLDAKDVYEALNKYDIFIYDTIISRQLEHSILIPNEDSNKFEIHNLGNVGFSYPITDELRRYNYWGVFKIPKNKELVFKRVAFIGPGDDKKTYLNKIETWYNNDYKKSIKKED